MAKEARDARIQEGSWRKGPERVIEGRGQWPPQGVFHPSGD